jgi:hypothetical protein
MYGKNPSLVETRFYARLGGMVDVEIEAGVMHLRVHGFDRVLSLRSELSIPMAHVLGAERAGPDVHAVSHGIRAGTNVPGVITAGTFWQDGSKAFWDVHDPEHAIEILLEHDAFERLVVQPEDADAVIVQINEAVKAQRPSV